MNPLAAMPFDLELALLGLALLVMVVGAYGWVRSYRRRLKEEETPLLTPQQQLEQYQAMLEDGLLLPEEFERLRQKLEGKKQTPDGLSPSDRPAGEA